MYKYIIRIIRYKCTGKENEFKKCIQNSKILKEFKKSKIRKIFVNDKKHNLLTRYAVQNLDLDDLLFCPHDTITLKDKLRVLNRLKAANVILKRSIS